LVHVDAAGKAARQRTYRDKLMAAPAPVPWLVEALIKERLLLAEDVGGRAVVALAHEALIQEWPALNEWLGHNRDRLRIGGLLSTISTMRGVLILGRFTPERKSVLDAVSDELRKRDYLPILFDFETPAGKDISETLSLLAHMARFVIADLTDAKNLAQELYTIVPNNPSLPVQPLILATEAEFAMFDAFSRYPWVLAPYRYHTLDQLISDFDKRVIGPLEAARATLEARGRVKPS
jgi:hypothetical protein